MRPSQVVVTCQPNLSADRACQDPCNRSAETNRRARLTDVDRVDLNAHNFAVVAGTDHPDRLAQPGRQGQAFVTRHSDEHTDDAFVRGGGRGRRTRGAGLPGQNSAPDGSTASSRSVATASAAPSIAAMCTAGGRPTALRPSSSASAWPTGSHLTKA